MREQLNCELFAQVEHLVVSTPTRISNNLLMGVLLYAITPLLDDKMKRYRLEAVKHI